MSALVSRIASTVDFDRRVVAARARRKPIDPARLAQLAADPAIKSGAIARMFDYGRAAFFKQLSANPELWVVYARARQSAGIQVLRGRPTERRTHRGALDKDEEIIVGCIGDGIVASELIKAAIAAGIDPRRYSGLLYNLEHEKHEIESREIGHATHYFVRDREAEKEVA